MVSPLPRKTVLVVDDEPSVRELLAMIVADAGYVSHSVESAEAALRALESIAPDTCLVISDVVLGGMDGFDLAQRVRAKYPELPVLLISGYLGEGHDLASLPDGIEFRRKPIAVRDIKAVLDASCSLG